ncbi:ankyrin repeat and SAM domain-containing protein 4B-like [Nerophis lumbriciformis]|uniref:ankyrin repeat and SAM domain-containing protein 4B-like n=1 Tax=Nerophis lumbriciformis TaxID=546530 RepID=UPI003BA9F415
MSRYHKAAIDGNSDLLKEATRKDLNWPDEDGMTPTLLAAFHGHVNALQLICSRGGDPNRSDIWGNTPLHHAAANDHMHILSFLVSFDANLFALDNDFHTAMDVAASRDRMECVRFLDGAASQQTSQNPKRVARLKKEASKEAEKRRKLCEKVKRRHQSKMNKMYRGADAAGSVSEVSETSALPSSDTVSEQFSKLIASDQTGSLTARVRGTLQKKLGKKEKGTLQRSGADGNVIFLKQEDGAAGNPDFLDVFTEQDERRLEEEEEADHGEDSDSGQVKQSIFNRPGLGGLIFMKRMSLDTEEVFSGSSENLGYLVENETLEAEEEGNANTDVPWEQEDLGLDDEEEEETSPLDAFLSSMSLSEFALAFTREHLDLEALMLCSDEDLKSIRIQLGLRKKILEAVSRRKNVLERPCAMGDSCL